MVVAIAPAPIAAMKDGAAAVKGRVAEIYGDKFVLADDTGRALVETGPALVTWRIGDRIVSEAEGRAAMAEALASHRERVELELGGDVLAAYRANGPDWRERMVAALRTAAGL